MPETSYLRKLHVVNFACYTKKLFDKAMTTGKSTFQFCMRMHGGGIADYQTV